MIPLVAIVSILATSFIIYAVWHIVLLKVLPGILPLTLPQALILGFFYHLMQTKIKINVKK